MSFKTAILKTLIYADIFDYPLTSDEIEKWLIKLKAQSSKLKVTTQNLNLKKLIEKKNGYYYLPDRSKLVTIREKRIKASREKFKIAQRAVKFLRIIPSVQLVGITGALAMENADKDDDIDLFIISSSGFVWTTRFFVTLLMQIIGMRRIPGQKRVKDKICLNMYVDEDHLAVPKTEWNLFTAHEVLQMRPLWERNNSYAKFISSNKWVGKYLPNAFTRIMNHELRIMNKEHKKFSILNSQFSILEKFLKFFQLWYMRSRRTTEKISNGVIRFHPSDVSQKVLALYNQKRRRYQL